jgi:hypothetical protein
MDHFWSGVVVMGFIQMVMANYYATPGSSGPTVPSLGAKASAGTTTNTNSAVTIDTTAGRQLYAFVEQQASATTSPTITDTINGSASGNTWKRIGGNHKVYTYDAWLSLHRCDGTARGNTHNFTVTMSGGYPAIWVFELVGSGILLEVDGGGNFDISAPYNSNSITNVSPDALLVCWAVLNSQSQTHTYTWSNNFTSAGIDIADNTYWTGSLATQTVANVSSRSGQASATGTVTEGGFRILSFSMLTPSDNFTRANNSDLGASWTVAAGFVSFKITSNVAEPSSYASECAEVYTGVEWNNDQWSEVTISNLDSGAPYYAGPGAMCRASTGGGNANCYRAVGGINGWFVEKWVNGTYTELASSSTPTFANGDRIKLELQGNVYRFYKNGTTLITSGTDNSLASGNAGITYSTTTTTGNITLWTGGVF